MGLIMAYHNNGIMINDIDDFLDYWDYDKNSEIGLDPRTVPVNSYKAAFWKCKNGHSWKEKTVLMFKRKVKCEYCSGRLILSGYNDLETLYPYLASEWDKEKNQISPNKVSPHDKHLYWWRCKNCQNSYQRSVEHRVRGHNTCPFCSASFQASDCDPARLDPCLLKKIPLPDAEGLGFKQILILLALRSGWHLP